ncbi:putative glycosyltransferase EpsD [bioreactor metagenome]|uniref:Putative glycosyltransferase EpsD n=1 Tax=bioreactor metagenome TaxID=1076179 RepID=A0A644VFG5_9ZZZZ|nr:glycosyltransferase family 4 protein [Lentimicrobium sp.]MEA5112139.1 glycosyltransferase family 4 protein [Lentimicrobium sp.]
MNKNCKILFVANIHKHFLAFHLPYIKWFQENGYEVHVAANDDSVIVPLVDKQWNICIERNPFSRNNVKAYRELKSIVEKEKYCLVTSHTAMGGVLARLASRKARKNFGLKVLYTVHGFHFFKGSPKSYWLLYYPMEKFLSRYTDAIITINQEDLELVKSHSFKNKATYIIPGIGFNADRLKKVNEDQKQALRVKNGYKQSDFIVIYVAEYIPRKNHGFIIDALPEITKKIPEIKVLFAGRGRDMELTMEYAKSKAVDQYIEFLGFRDDIGNLIALSDVGISASKQEGLGLNLAEEMYSGLPVVASKDRGHKEMIIHGENGFLFPQNDNIAFIEAIIYLYENPEKRKEMGKYAAESIRKFSLENSLTEMVKIYKRYLQQS